MKTATLAAEWDRRAKLAFADDLPAVAAVWLKASGELRDLGAAGCPYLVTADEGTSYCALAEETWRRAIEAAAEACEKLAVHWRDLAERVNTCCREARADSLADAAQQIRALAPSPAPELTPIMWQSDCDDLISMTGAELWIYPKRAPEPGLGPYPTFEAALTAYRAMRKEPDRG